MGIGIISDIHHASDFIPIYDPRFLRMAVFTQLFTTLHKQPGPCSSSVSSGTRSTLSTRSTPLASSSVECPYRPPSYGFSSGGGDLISLRRVYVSGSVYCASSRGDDGWGVVGISGIVLRRRLGVVEEAVWRCVID